MTRKLLMALLAALLLVALPGAAAFAQEEEPPIACGDLSDDDCEMLKESRLAMMELTEYTAQLDLAMSLSDLPNLPKDLSVSLTSDGVFHVDPELSAQLSGMQGMSPEEMMEDMEQIADLLSDLYFTIAFDLMLDLQVSEDIADLLSMQAGMPLPEELNLPMRMVDGYFYLNIDDLAKMIPDAEGLEGWLGIDVGTLMSDALEQSMAQMEQGAMPANPAMTGMVLANIQQNLAIQEAVNDFIQVERLDDAEVDGVEVAQFRYTFDVAAFVSSPEFMEMMMSQLKIQMAANPDMAETMPMTEEDMEMLAAMAPMMAPMLLSGLEFDTVSSIGLEDKYVYATETHVDWDLSTIVNLAAAAGQGKPSRAKPAGSSSFTYDLMVTNADFDDAPEVEAPEDAIIIPLDAIQPGPIM